MVLPHTDCAVAVDQRSTMENIILNKMAHEHIRVAVMGDVDASKSTLIGTLVTDTFDDGRGLARSKIIKHRHELETGRTSTITTHMMGLKEGTFETVTGGHQKIALHADRVVTFMDLAGHEKHLKTTVRGIASGMSDYALVLVYAGQPPTAMTAQHLKLCISMSIPVIVLLTKMDRCPNHLFQETKQKLAQMLKSRDLGQLPFMVKTTGDVDVVTAKLPHLVPLIPVSCIAGDGLGLLRMLLTKLPPRRHHAKRQLDKPFEYMVEDIFQVRGVGTVVSGFVTRGSLEKGEPIFMGPLKDGTVMQVIPKSIHVAQTCVARVFAGHQVCFALPKLPRIFRTMLGKRMIAMKRSFEPSRKFVADIFLTKGSTVTIQSGKFDVTLHILHMKLSAKVVEIRVDCKKQQVIRQGDTARCVFDLLNKPAYIRPGMRIILRSGHVIGYGLVKAAC